MHRGTLDEIEQKWNEDGDIKEMPDYKSLPATNGTLTLATEALYEPFTYIQNGQIVGYCRQPHPYQRRPQKAKD